MALEESPAVARRRLRLALRKAREATGMTQSQVADALDWSLSKVNRIENGEVTISSTDLRALLGLLGVTEQAAVDSLAALARMARQKGWWDQPQYREYLSPGMRELLQFETEASAIRSFQALLLPGLFQTRAYAEAVMNLWPDRLDGVQAATLLAVRMGRRAQVFRGTDPPPFYVVLDESVVSRQVGGPAVMAEQLKELLDITGSAAVFLRVLPLADPHTMALINGFTVLDLGDEENAVLYREDNGVDVVVHAADRVQWFRQVFEQMWRHSLAEAASRRLVAARHADLLTSLDSSSHRE
jgi:transcriptional regulator with XRE-family HTH domain